MTNERQAIDEYRSEAPGLRYFAFNRAVETTPAPADLTPEKLNAAIDVIQNRLRADLQECLCCENPPAVDVPGRAAIEDTLRQAKERELGDVASDPFEMEAE